MSIALIGSFFLITACSSSPPVRYFSLDHAEAGNTSQGENNRIVELGPIELPGYLSRSQIVSRGQDAELIVDDFHRWAEPLDETVTRVLATGLESHMDNISVVSFPKRNSVQPDHRVHAKVNRFDVDESGLAVLVVQWTVSDRSHQSDAVPLRSRYESKVPGGSDIGARVHALSNTLDQFSRDIAERLRSVTGSN